MAREIHLLNMKVDKRYLNKEYTTVTILNDCHFKDDEELINPIVRLSSFNKNTTNYIYIPSLDRYYYVTNVTYSKPYYYISLHVDVLMSFKESIKNQRALISRGSKWVNLYMSDDKFKTQQYTCDRYIPFEGADAFDYDTQNYILAVMGTGGDTPESDDINVNISSMPTVDVTGSVGTHDDTPTPPPITNQEEPNNL